MQNRVINTIISIAIVCFILWLCFFPTTDKTNESVDLTKYTKVLEVHDTIYNTKILKVYKKGDSIPFKVIDSVRITVQDSVRIINEYLQIKAYTDTIKKDSNIFVINDTISQNRIISRGFIANMTTKTIVLREYYTKKQTNSLYLGIRGDFRQDNGLETLSPSLILNVKNRAQIGFSVDINKNYNIGYSGGIYFKLGKK